MPSENADLVRSAFEAYANGDLAAMLELVDPGLEWTYLDPSLEDPEPEVCRGRQQLVYWLGRQHDRGLRSEVEEIASYGEKVLAVTRTSGIDRERKRQADDRNFHVLTLEDGRITALRACRSREEAVAFASAE